MSAIITSQKFELLVSELEVALYTGLTRKIVIVPSDEVKSAIFSQLSREKGVAFGAKFYKNTQGVRHILRQLGRHPHFPTPNALALHLEMELPQIEELQPLLTTPKRLRDFADHMSQLFLRYTKAEDLKLSGWQKILWNKVFSVWDAPATYLPLVDPSGSNLEVHVFGYLPKVYRNFLARMPHVRFYFLNPTQEFWDDLLSDRSRLRMERFHQKRGVAEAEIEQFMELTEEHHPLLANFGRVGAELFSAYQDLELPYVERFAKQESETLLETLQNDLLEMKHSEYVADDSIQLHSSCSPLREIEVLKTTLFNLFAEHPNLKPSDVLVLSPNIASYESHIELTFGSSDLPLPYAISDLPFARKNGAAGALLYLFSLQNRMWEREEILKFFHFAAVKEHLHFSDHELKTVENWLCDLHVKWGYDEPHRTGTWEEAFYRLLLGLAMEEEGEHLAYPLELSEAELLGRFLQAVRCLRKDLFVMEKEERTLLGWTEFLRDVCARYMGYVDFQEELNRLGELLPESVYPFASVERAIKRELAKSGDRVYGVNQNCVRFSSLKSGVARPAKVIALLGMENFPHKESFSSLQQVRNLGPTPSDEDRYLFLEILISARDHLLFFYSNLSAQDGRSQGVSPLVQELVDYLNVDLKRAHPPYPFHPSYFSDGPRSYSLLDFAKATQKVERKPFFAGVETETAKVISIRQLTKLAKNPLRFYLNETLGIHLPFEYEEEFLLAPWEGKAMRLQALRGELHLEEVTRAGKLPSGKFEKVATLRLEKQAEPLRQGFKLLGVKPEEIFDVELKSGCDKPYRLNQRRWILPALRVGEVEIVGVIENICADGLLHPAGAKLKELLPIWPTYLVFREIASSLECKNSLLLLNEAKRLQVAGSYLKSFLEYFEEAKKTPSPFSPSQAESLLRGKPTPHSTQYLDPHLEWALARELPPPKNWEERISKYFSYFTDKEVLLSSSTICR